jgi:hypothetical protein
MTEAHGAHEAQPAEEPARSAWVRLWRAGRPQSLKHKSQPTTRSKNSYAVI